jgi:YebC/PmpR family DNA-binding regulatory protein
MGAQWKQKGRTESAAAKGKLFTKLSKEIMIAAKAGGADPAMNPRLRLAVEAAKKASMTRDTLERAIKKGSGQLDEQVTYELVTYEGFGPHQLPVIVECLTENKNRTAGNIRPLFNKYGSLAASGAIAWDFRHLGVIEALPPAAGADPETAAIEAGADELEPGEEGATRFFTELTALDHVSKALGAAGWNVQSANLQWIPKNPLALEGEARAKAEAFLEKLDEDDDVQNIYVGMK